MKIRTSYFGKIKRLPEGAVLVSIARFPPKWFKGYTMKSLAPSESLLRDYKRSRDKDDYIRRYHEEVLCKIDIEKLIRALSKAGEYVILLCYERSDDFCHRHLLAEYLRSKGIDVVEYGEEAA